MAVVIATDSMSRRSIDDAQLWFQDFLVRSICKAADKFEREKSALGKYLFIKNEALVRERLQCAPQFNVIGTMI